MNQLWHWFVLLPHADVHPYRWYTILAFSVICSVWVVPRKGAVRTFVVFAIVSIALMVACDRYDALTLHETQHNDQVPSP